MQEEEREEEKAGTDQSKWGWLKFMYNISAS